MGIFAGQLISNGLQLSETADPTRGQWIRFSTVEAILISLLILICYKTGEKPDWRWGNNPKRARLVKQITIAGIIILGVLVPLLIWKTLKPDDLVYCTQEAKLCPDGLYVGRTGPACEFAACSAPDEESWKTFTDTKTGTRFQYPKELATKFISVQNWPPKIIVSTEKFSCQEGASAVWDPGKTTGKVIDGRTYCLTLETEGAAGSLYNTYKYVTEKNAKLVTLTFTLRYPQCANYDEPSKSECEEEQAGFDVDALANEMVETIKF